MSVPRVIHGFGRKDRLDTKALQRLALSITRFLEPEDAAGVRLAAEDAGVDAVEFLGARQLGGTHLLDGLWRQLELGKVITRLAGERKFRVPIERLLFALVAHRALEPGSKLSVESWVEGVHIDGLSGVDVQQLYRVMDFLLECEVDLQREVFWQVRNLFNLEVDLVFVDTTSTYFEIEDEDADKPLDDPLDDLGDADATGSSAPAVTAGASAGDEADSTATTAAVVPGLRKRNRHSKDKRPDVPQSVIGFAITREGIPIRSWTFPGNTSDQNLVERIRDDLGAWQLGRVIMVMDSGFNSKRNRDIIRQSGCDFIIGEKLRHGPKARQAKVLATPGRYKLLPNGLRIKDVTTSGGTGYKGKNDGDIRRFIIAHNPDAAQRDAAKRADIVAETKRRITMLGQPGDKGHSKAVCSLKAHAVFGRYVKELKGGRLIIDKQKIERDERLDGKYLLSTSNTTLPAEDIAGGYRQLAEIERLNRDLKHTVDVRPVYHYKEERIRAHVTLCWLALLLIRIAENETGRTWHAIKRVMKQLFAADHATTSGTFTHTNPLTNEQKTVLKALNVTPPKRVLAARTR